MNFNKYKNHIKQYDVDLNLNIIKKHLKKLIFAKQKSLGRSSGAIVTWHKGGGVKHHYRHLWNYQNFNDHKYMLIRNIEYDPNRSAFIALVQYEDGSFCNIIVSSDNYVNQIIKLQNKNLTNIKNGDFIKLRDVPKGMLIYNVEKFPGSGPIYSKAAGVSSLLLTKNLEYAKIKLPSGEERLFDLDCLVTLGNSSNKYKCFNKKYKAGTNRLLNKRPVVRGVAMNPIDHPHGGGNGKSTPGRPSVSPWGKLTKGVPTRNKKLISKLIIKRRK